MSGPHRGAAAVEHQHAAAIVTAAVMSVATGVGAEEEAGAEDDGGDEHDAGDDAHPGEHLHEPARPVLGGRGRHRCDGCGLGCHHWLGCGIGRGISHATSMEALLRC
ncbi:hypothetical protein H7H51_30210 [Mycolicibacterium farcinogenes]|nr:hypothetical protein [Mycolicibacterium farcinogenes]